MPKQNPNNGYFICRYCKKEIKLLPMLLHHEEEHNIIFLPLEEDAIKRLIQLIYTKDFSLLEDDLGQRLVNTLMKYRGFRIKKPPTQYSEEKQ